MDSQPNEVRCEVEITPELLGAAQAAIGEALWRRNQRLSGDLRLRLHPIQGALRVVLIGGGSIGVLLLMFQGLALLRESLTLFLVSFVLFPVVIFVGLHPPDPALPPWTAPYGFGWARRFAHAMCRRAARRSVAKARAAAPYRAEHVWNGTRLITRVERLNQTLELAPDGRCPGARVPRGAVPVLSPGRRAPFGAALLLPDGPVRDALTAALRDSGCEALSLDEPWPRWEPQRPDAAR